MPAMPEHPTTDDRHRPMAPVLCCLAALLLSPASLAAADLDIDCAQPAGTIRPLHGGNGGPLLAGGLTELSAAYRELAVPSIRLHDCHWPNPDVVDIHAVFPDFRADPDRPESYDFAATDEYVAAVRATGAQVVYRLGESIEHTRRKRYVHPPADCDRWAAICVGLVRHYNEGWAGGAHHGIRYWEIWNEPENRPAMWSGTDDDYLRLYTAAARALKARFPDLKIGGPSLGASGELLHGRFEPTPFLVRFLEYCRDQKLPLDFFSWHL
jgi:xylan 1,4-beta-xylosidase